MKEYPDVLVDKEGYLAIVTLNAPHKMNAFTAEMRIGLPAAVKDISQDDDVRVVILTGAGRGFCSGADVSAMQSRHEARAHAPRHELLEVVGPLGALFPSLNKPVIAAINGACVGAGLSLALGCDIRVCSDTARFFIAQVSRALVPDAGMTFFLPHAVGTSKALELMYTAEPFDAAEALRIGIVSRVVAPDKVVPTAKEIAAKIAKQAPIPVEMTKKMVWRALNDQIAYQLDLETAAQRTCWQTQDHLESVRAFMEKRPTPEYKGR